MISGKTIFIAPLDWGFGHATRCAPLIAELAAENRVIIGTTSQNRFFFDKTFPALEQIGLPSYNIVYSGQWPAWLKVLMQAPRILLTMRKERKQLKQILRLWKIDMVISDSRYGLADPLVHCVLMTHQLQLHPPLFPSLANAINRRFIHRFNEVWVPDDPAQNLSGSLSDVFRINVPVKYVGVKSQLTIGNAAKNKEYDLLILLSGAEPQRTLLEKLIMESLEPLDLKIVLVRGSSRPPGAVSGNLHVRDFVFAEELSALIASSRTVICRSGYSSLMDLWVMGHRRIILVPTPGQPEQEYLAEHWRKKFGSVHLRQAQIRTFDFEKALKPEMIGSA